MKSTCPQCGEHDTIYIRVDGQLVCRRHQDEYVLSYVDAYLESEFERHLDEELDRAARVWGAS